MTEKLMMQTGNTMNRTKDQRFANALDCELYCLVYKTEQQRDPHWRKVAHLLQAIRPEIRSRMHREDREKTA